MQKQSWTDLEIIEAIQAGGARREAALKHIVQQSGWKESVANLIAPEKRNLADVEEIFQESLIAFHRKIWDRQYEGRSTLKTYFLGIAKNKWFTLLRSRRPLEEYAEQDADTHVADAEAVLISADAVAWLTKQMNLMDERCKRLILLAYNGYSSAEIAETVPFSSPEMAKKALYRCRKHYRELLGDRLKDFLN